MVVHEDYYQAPVPPQAHPSYTIEPPLPQYAPRRFHWLVFVGLFLLAALAFAFVILALDGRWQTQLNDWQYGRPRTFQIDWVVGHHDNLTNPSHFFAINLRRHVLVIECPGGDCTKATIYSGPYLTGPEQDLTPITLSFVDVSGNGKPEMLVHIQDLTLTFLNVDGKFKAVQPPT